VILSALIVDNTQGLVVPVRIVRQPLRPYQVRALEEVRAFIVRGKKRILIVAPTGAGKTTIAAEIILGAVQKSSPSMFLAHRRELIDQCSRRLDQWDVNHGVIMAKHVRWAPRRLVQVASVDTLRNRLRSGRWDAISKLILIDEAHRSTAPSYFDDPDPAEGYRGGIVNQHPDAIVLGLTATPCRMNGRGLGDLYEEMVMVAQPDELIRDGFLIEPTIYAPETPDLSGVHSKDGDYKAEELERAVNKAGLVGGVVSNAERLIGRGKRIVVFAAGVQHSLHLRDKFREAGFRAEHVDGESETAHRDRVLADLNSGALEVVTNVAILTEGWDLPALDAVIDAQPTKSVSRYLQKCGRVLRPYPGIERKYIIDHAGNVDRHGWPTCPRDWDLKSGAPKEKPLQPKQCPRCGLVLKPRALRCDPPPIGCGLEFEREERSTIEEVDGELRERRPPTVEEMTEFLFEKLCRAKRFNMQESEDGFPGFAAHEFKRTYHRWPTRREKTEALARYHQAAF
jgi:superfamily II DNA or RNA helicase